MVKVRWIDTDIRYRKETIVLRLSRTKLQPVLYFGRGEIIARHEVRIRHRDSDSIRASNRDYRRRIVC